VADDEVRRLRLAAGTEGSAVPPEFVHMIRQALVHLYDPVDLLQNPLTFLLAASFPGGGSRSQGLRAFLLDAIDYLEPGEKSTLSEKERRPHAVLVDRYIGGSSFDDIAAKMHIGSRQVRREHDEGVRALAAHIWATCSSQFAESGGSERETGLKTEVEALGVQLSEVPLAQVVQASQPAANALAEGYGVVLGGLEGGLEAMCLCDIALAKQAFLSCLGGVCAQRPEYMKVVASVVHGAPSLELRALPRLDVRDREAFQAGLETGNALLAGQSGVARPIYADSGSCLGIRLQFRRSQGAVVFVVDDNEKMLQLYARYLARGEYRVVSATSGAEAEAVLERERPDVIILDVMMRETDGWELLQRLHSRAELHDTPIVVCSVLNEPNLAYFLGAKAYLKKPVSADDMLAVVSRLLTGSSPERVNEPKR